MTMHDIFQWGTAAIEVFQPVGEITHTLLSRPSHEEPTSASVPSIKTPTHSLPQPGSCPETETPSTNIPFLPYHFQSGPDVVGIRSAGGRDVGTPGPVAAQHPHWTSGMDPSKKTLKKMYTELRDKYYARDVSTGEWFVRYDDKDVVVFPLNGETITEVHVEQQYRALKLVTQTGRVGYFGLPGCTE
jgi:hypothetical protein